MKFASAITPYSEAERRQDAADAREGRSIAHRRRVACPSGQRYDIKPTAEQQRLGRRIVGEGEDA